MIFFSKILGKYKDFICNRNIFNGHFFINLMHQLNKTIEKIILLTSVFWKVMYVNTKYNLIWSVKKNLKPKISILEFNDIQIYYKW